MKHSAHSLQNRLLLLVLGVVVVVWMATAWLTWRDVSHELDELLDGHLAQAAAILVAQQAQEFDDDSPGVDAPSLHRYAPKVAFQIFHEDRLALRSTNAPVTPMAGDGASFRTGFETVEMAGTPWRVFATFGTEPDVRVYVGEEAASRASILWAALRSTLLPMAVALPLLALALWWAVYRSVRPMRELGDTLSQRRPDALQPLALDGVPSEMTPMVEALNGLFGRIGKLMESERRFTADASHELRTPIAAIRAQAQVALGEHDDAMRRHALQSTLAGCDRAIHLVEQLLTLSRLEVAEVPSMLQIDLAALTRQVVGDLAPQAIARSQSLEFDGTEPSRFTGNEALLSILIRNLVDNAIRYSPPGARIRVTVSTRNQRARLLVEDSGPGLPDGDLARLGERFFRVPGSQETGSGLGWSIVRRIASVHRMELRVTRSTDFGGLSVLVESAPDSMA